MFSFLICHVVSVDRYIPYKHKSSLGFSIIFRSKGTLKLKSLRTVYLLVSQNLGSLIGKTWGCQLESTDIYIVFFVTEAINDEPHHSAQSQTQYSRNDYDISYWAFELFCVCVMVGFCLQVWIILSVILYVTVIFLNDIWTLQCIYRKLNFPEWKFVLRIGHVLSFYLIQNKTKLQHMCSE